LNKEIILSTRQQIDEQRWQEALLATKGSHVYARPWYLDIVSKEWKALVYGDYEAVMPLTAGKKYGINYLYQPFFTQQLGVYGKAAQENAVVLEMLEQAKSLFSYAEINMHEGQSLQGCLIDIKQRTNLIIPLKAGLSAIRKDYSDTLKRNLKKAAAQAFQVKDMEDISFFLDEYMLHTASKTKEINSRHRSLLHLLLQQAMQQKAGMIRGVFQGEKCVAACFYLLDEERCVSLLPWADEQAKKYGAAAFLVDSTLEMMENKLNYFDFEGSEIPGVARFYRQFAPQEAPYYRLKWNNLPKVVKWLKR